jgi:hypothetical protein
MQGKCRAAALDKRGCRMFLPVFTGTLPSVVPGQMGLHRIVVMIYRGQGVR